MDQDITAHVDVLENPKNFENFVTGLNILGCRLTFSTSLPS